MHLLLQVNKKMDLLNYILLVNILHHNLKLINILLQKIHIAEIQK